MADLGVAALNQAIRDLQERFDLDSVRVGARVTGGHTIFLTVVRGAPTTLEREDGHSMIASQIGL